MANPLTDKQRDLIGKLLGMAGSANRHEALGHFLKAKQMLDSSSDTWLDLVSGRNDAGFMAARAALRRSEAREKRLKAELDKLQAELDKLRADYGAALAALDKLTPARDPWQDRLEAILKQHDMTHRWTAYELMQELGVSDRDLDTDTYRRLSRVMQAIGGWKQSNNVAAHIQDGGGRVRGYVRRREI